MLKRIIFLLLLIAGIVGASNVLAASNFEVEDNGRLNRSTEIRVNEEYQGYFTDMFDKDYYTFKIDNPGKVTLSVYNNPEGTYNFYIYNENGIRLETLNNYDTGKETVRVDIGLPKGTYYVLASPNGGGEFHYSFTVSFTESEFYEKETNDSIKKANPIELNQTYQGYFIDMFDKDYYAFKIDKPGKVTLSAYNNPEGIYDFYIYSENGTRIGHLNNYYDAKETITLDLVLSQGTYFIEVDANDGGGYPYSFTLKTQENKVTNSSVAVYINGKKQSYDQPPVVENGRTLVPLRGIFEALGATVQWDQQKQLVTAKRSGTNIQLKIGSKSPTVNGKVVPIDVPARVKNGRTLVPLRFIGEALGANVNYDATSRTIKITSK